VIREMVPDRTLPDLEVRPAGPAEKEVVDQLLELYLHDLSELTGADVGSHGRYDYFFLDDYWSEPDRHPFLLRVGGHLAGFALVGSGTPHDMAEFFVMRKYRRQRVGARAARTLFRMFPGEWQVRQIAANTAATKFWRAVIPAPFTEGTTEIGPVQRFESSIHDD